MEGEWIVEPRVGLEACGISRYRRAYWNLSVPALYEEAARRQEGLIADAGPLVVRTGRHTGRSPGDRFIVREPSSESRIDWGSVNKPFPEERFEALRARVTAHYQD